MGEQRHIGFRVDANIAAEIQRALESKRWSTRADLVRDAVLRGLELLDSDPTPAISAIAAAAGQKQLSVQLAPEVMARAESLRARLTNARGQPDVRVFLVRECLLRGLRDLQRPPKLGRLAGQSAALAAEAAHERAHRGRALWAWLRGLGAGVGLGGAVRPR